MKLVVLASGRGSRLDDLTINNPKCLVKINENRIIDYMYELSTFFEETIIIGGYKYELLNDVLYNSKIIVNEEYLNTNMVHSLFKSIDYVNDDFIVVYADIIFDNKIVTNLINKKNTILPLKKNWLEYWMQRMNIDDIKKDAENLLVNKNKIIEIGTKIKDKMPNYQYMGILKFNYIDFLKLDVFYKKIKNQRIDMTSFLNLAIHNQVIDIFYQSTNDFWLEIDNKTDLNLAKKILRQKVK